MNQIKDAGTTLFSAKHTHISKHTNLSSVVVSIVIALVGVTSVYLSLQMDAASTTLSMSLLTLGTILILIALYRIFWKSVEFVYTPTGSVVREGSYFSEVEDLPVLQRLMESKNFEQAQPVAFKQSGNGRMDYMISKDGKFAAVQLFRFIPYTYEPVSGIYYYTDADAQALLHYLESKNN